MVWEFEYDEVDHDRKIYIDNDYVDDYENVPEWDLSHGDISKLECSVVKM